MRHAAVLVVAVAVLCLGADAQSPPALVVSGVTVVDVAAGRVGTDMRVVVEADRIVRVGKTADTRVPAGAQVVDGRGQFLIPGLWDMHVHLSYARASALPVLVANGVTSVRDLGSSLSELDVWRGQIAARSIVGPRIIRAGPILNDREFNRYQLAIANAADARMTVRALHKAGVDTIKTHRRTSREAYFAMAEESRRLALPFTGHVPMTVTPAEASDAGQNPLEHAETLFEGTFATATAGKNQTQAVREWAASAEATELFRKLVANGTAVTPTLMTTQRVLQFLESTTPDPRDRYVAASALRESDDTFGKARGSSEKLLAERKPLFLEVRNVVRLMNRAGITLLTGTDLSFSSFIHPGFSVHEEMAQLVEAGLTAAEALRAATINPGRLFPAHHVGTIEPGKRADFLLLDANPLSEIRNTQRIRAVVLDGRLLDRKALDRLLATAVELAKRS